ncbi:MAG: recombination protein RecR [Candidatus Magasanikbacteria bacterium]|nr:recombination protein RecR [Candidatus Magasanikbacteria bacterium]
MNCQWQSLFFSVIFSTGMYSSAVKNLLAVLERLPGVGPKTAERFVLHFLKTGKGEVARLQMALEELSQKVKSCAVCQNFAEASPCEICADQKRDHRQIAVVAEPQDVAAIEHSGEFHGVYHILRGVLNPLEGIGPEQIKIAELLDRVRRATAAGEPIQEIILALNPDIEGEATMNFLNRELAAPDAAEPRGVKVTRLAKGLPMGSDIEYADDATLASAFKGRREI